MEDKVVKGLELIRRGIKFTLQFFLLMINTMITLTILGGSIVSFILLYKLYPEIFVDVFSIIVPAITLLTIIFQIIIGILAVLLISYLSIHLIIFLLNKGKVKKAS